MLLGLGSLLMVSVIWFSSLWGMGSPQLCFQLVSFPLSFSAALDGGIKQLSELKKQNACMHLIGRSLGGLGGGLVLYSKLRSICDADGGSGNLEGCVVGGGVDGWLNTGMRLTLDLRRHLVICSSLLMTEVIDVNVLCLQIYITAIHVGVFPTAVFV